MQLRFHRELVAQQLTQGRNVPLAVAEREEDLADRVLGLHPKGAKERAIRLRNAKFGVQDDEGLPDRVDDIEQQALGGGHFARRRVVVRRCQCLDVRHGRPPQSALRRRVP